MRCCKECKHALLDEKLGEFKCKIVQHRIYDVDRIVACKDYKKGKPEIKEADVEES